MYDMYMVIKQKNIIYAISYIKLVLENRGEMTLTLRI